MSPSLIIALAIFSIAGLVIASILSKIVKLGGLRGVAFGARIVRTVGEITRANPNGGNVTVRVHVLAEGATGNAVGLEFISKGSSTYKSLAMSVPASVVEELVQLLKTAVSERVAA